MTTPPNWQSKIEAGWPSLEYTGGNRNELTFRGPTGRTYRFGNNPYHKVVSVHPKDYSHLMRFGSFRQATATNARPLMVEARQKRGNGTKIDIGYEDYKELRKIDLTDQDILALMQQEREGKNRKYVLMYLEHYHLRKTRELRSQLAGVKNA